MPLAVEVQPDSPKPRQVTGPAAFAMRHSRSVMLLILGLCIWGLAALRMLPSSIYPDVAFPRIVVIAERGDDSPLNMMTAVTRPFEQALGTVQGLSRIRSKTIRGASEISLDFTPSTEMREALAQTRARLADAAGKLDPPAQLTIEQQTPSVFPIISFNVTLDPNSHDDLMRDGADLLDWTMQTLRPRLARLPDVFMVTTQGSDQREVAIEADPAKLATSGLTLDDLSKALQESNSIDAAGVIEKDYRQFQVLVSGQIKNLDELANVALTARGGVTLRLGDVARIRRGLADRTAVVTGNGDDAVVVSVFMRYGGKVTELSRHVRETLDDLRAALPPGVRLTPVYDQAELVTASMLGVRDAIIIGILLTVAILWIFLNSWRLTLVAALVIPVSLLITFALLSVTGQSLNLMSLGGIAIAIGLIIDDAIVVVENIARRTHGGTGRRRAIAMATKEVFGAVVGSSLTTVVVFLPLVLLEGLIGQFFIALAVGLSVGILVSMVVSLTLAPLIAAGPLGPRSDQSAGRRWMRGLAGLYVRLMGSALRHPLWASLLMILVLSAAAVPALDQKTDFLPEMDEGAFVLDYTMPVGTSLSETDSNCRKIEAILKQVPEIANFSRRTGMELGFFATEQFTGDFLVALKPRSQRERAIFEVMDDVRDRIQREVPQIEVEFIQAMQDTLNDLQGNPAPVELKVFGTDYKQMQEVAEQFAGEMEKLPAPAQDDASTAGLALVDVTPTETFGSPELTYHIDADAARRAGLSPGDVARQMQTALVGGEVMKLREGERLVPVRLRYPAAMRRDPTWLADLPLATSAGKSIPASLVAKLDERNDVNELNRENQQPVVAVTAALASGTHLGPATAAMRELIAHHKIPDGVQVELGGQSDSQQAFFHKMAIVLGLACALVFFLLVIQFRSLRLPFIIFLTLPPSQIGALLALRFTGTALNISSTMGLVMLIGLVVKNGIIFIEYAAQLREGGIPTLREALLEAGRVRLRPILMTSLTAIIAMSPLAFSLGAGAELQRPLAIAVIGGLSLSTLFSIFIIPIAHLLLGEPRHEAEEEALS